MKKTIEFVGLTVLMLWTILSAPQLTQNPGQGYKPPRTADGHPDLNGTYDIATITPLVRQVPVQRGPTDAHAAKEEGRIIQGRQEEDAQLTADQPVPPIR